MKVGNRLLSVGTLQQWLVSVSSRSNDTRMPQRHRKAFAIEVDDLIVSYNMVYSEIMMEWTFNPLNGVEVPK
jgi:hypothetical protein